MIRTLIDCFVVRFHSTEKLLLVMNLLERGYKSNEYEGSSKKELERKMRVIARELIRRKVIF